MYNIDWNERFTDCLDAKQYADIFYSVINECIELYVPISTIRSTKTVGVRYPPHIKKLQLKQKHYWRLYKKFGKNAYFTRYKITNSKCRKAIFYFIQNREDALIATGNLGKFYRYANSKLNSKTNVGPLRLPDGSLTVDPQAKANLLSDYFSSTFTVDDGVLPTLSTRTNATLDTVNFSQQAIFKALGRLKENSAGGPDGIPPIFLKIVRSQLATPLAFLYQLFFDSSFVPPIWLQAHITKKKKKGDSSSSCNYRPISLTCSVCKIMETVIKDQMVVFLATRGLLSKAQHAFIRRHSTVTNLLECAHDWSMSLHNHIPQDVIYFDFSRAFDAVVHSKLLTKVKSFGFGGKLLEWIGSFLRHRSQRVVVEKMFSNWVKVVSGVPQGSVLGPILFLLYIDDVTLIYPGRVTFKLFADDLKVYNSVESSADSNDLQQTLFELQNWCHTWQLHVNLSKTYVLHLGVKNRRENYYFDGTILTVVDSTRDLGVEVDVDLSFDQHISNIVSKASSRVGTLFRGFISRKPILLRKAFVTYIRPILEYASNIWSPYLLKHVNLIEKVQRNFTKRIPSLSNLAYAERLAVLNLETLECRRLKSDLIVYFKILNNHTPWPADQCFSVQNHERSTRRTVNRPTMLLAQPMCKTSRFQNEFFQRCVGAWNSLPNDVVDSPSVSCFKHKLETVDLSNYLSYRF